MKISEIEKAALHLPLKERATLSYKLLESIDSENIDNADEIWKDEVDKRYKQITSGEAKTKKAELVIKNQNMIKRSTYSPFISPSKLIR